MALECVFEFLCLCGCVSVWNRCVRLIRLKFKCFQWCCCYFDCTLLDRNQSKCCHNRIKFESHLNGSAEKWRNQNSFVLFLEVWPIPLTNDTLVYPQITCDYYKTVNVNVNGKLKWKMANGSEWNVERES